MLRSKKILTSLAILVLLLILSVGAAFAASASKGTITGNTVNVRTKPDTSSKIVTQLAKGTVVSVTDNQGDWYKISSSDASGWVSSKYITVGESVIGKGTINGNDVNVRSKPDTSSDSIAKFDKGTKVDIVSRAGDWYRIALGDDKYGWVNSDLVIYREGNTSRGIRDEISSRVDSVTADDSSESDKDLRQQVVAYAKRFLGVRYVYGGTSPNGFDCSGFVQYVFKHFGVKLDRSSTDQSLNGNKIKKSELKPGDTVYFDTNGGLNAVEHAGIYIGNGEFIHASSGRSSHKVVISDITEGYYDQCYMWACRVIDD